MKENLLKLTLAEIRNGLKGLRFRKRADDIFTLPVAPDVIGWLGLNAGSKQGQANINPVIGVRQSRIEELVSRLSGTPPHEYLPPSLSSPLGYLVPGRAEMPIWIVASASDVESTATSIVRGVADFGIPFIERNRELRELVRSLKGDSAMATIQKMFRIPAGLSLLGESALLEDYLTTQIRAIEGRTDPVAVRFRDFADGLRAEATRDGAVGR